MSFQFLRLIFILKGALYYFFLIVFLFLVAGYSSAEEKNRGIFNKENKNDYYNYKYQNSVVYLKTIEVVDKKTSKSFMQGTGFIVSKHGHFISAQHMFNYDKGKGKVVARIGSPNSEDNEELHVVYDDVEKAGKYDLVLGKITNPPDYIEVIELGDPWSVQLQDELVVAGFPGGSNYNVLKGILEEKDYKRKPDTWRTDIQFTSGNSGGPVFYKGKAVAVVQEGSSDSTIHKVVLPLIFASKLLEEAGISKPWKYDEEYLNEIKLKYGEIEKQYKLAKDIRMGRTKRAEAEKMLILQQNQEEASRSYHYQLFKLAGVLDELREHFLPAALEKALNSLKKGRVKPAVKLLEEISYGKGELGAEANFQLGLIAESKADFSRAFEHYERAIKLWPKNAFYFEAAARMAYEKDNLKNVFRWIKEAVAIRKQELGSKNPLYAATLCQLGEMYRRKSMEHKAIELCNEALSILDEAKDQEIEIAKVRGHLGAAYKYLGNYSQAEEEFMEAHDLLERIVSLKNDVRGKEMLGSNYNNLGMINLHLGRYKDGADFLEKAIKIDREMIGSNHPWLGVDLVNLAIVRLAQADYDTAADLISDALGMFNNAYGSENRYTAKALMRLATIKLIRRQEKIALDLAEKALEIQQDIRDNNIRVAETRMLLAEIKSRKGLHGKAMEELETAKLILESNNSSHALLVPNLILQAAIRSRQGRYDEGRKLCFEARAVKQKIYTYAHPLSGELSFQLGVIYFALSESEDATSEEKRNLVLDAIRELENAQRIFSKSLGELHPKRAAVLDELGRVYKYLGQETNYEGVNALASKIRETFAGEQVVTFIDL